MTRKIELLDPEELGTYSPNQVMKLLTCHFPQADIRTMNRLVHNQHFANRSEIIRMAVKSFLWEYGYYEQNK